MIDSGNLTGYEKAFRDAALRGPNGLVMMHGVSLDQVASVIAEFASHFERKQESEQDALVRLRKKYAAPIPVSHPLPVLNADHPMSRMELDQLKDKARKMMDAEKAAARDALIVKQADAHAQWAQKASGIGWQEDVLKELDLIEKAKRDTAKLRKELDAMPLGRTATVGWAEGRTATVANHMLMVQLLDAGAIASSTKGLGRTANVGKDFESMAKAVSRTTPGEQIKPAGTTTVRDDVLTKREYFAGLAMQGILAGDLDSALEYDDVAAAAVNNADALILELAE